VNYKEAFRLLFSDKAEVLCTYTKALKTVTREFLIPAVIRLTKKFKILFNVRLSRKNVFIRDGHRCQYCGKRLPASELTIDHVVPRSKGGSFKWENVVSSCLDCNAQKSDRTPEEARMPLLKRPAQLDQWQYIEKHISNIGQIDEWSDYV
jgi:5-methylcytosine-specific restriction endonuclease McrA